MEKKIKPFYCGVCQVKDCPILGDLRCKFVSLKEKCVLCELKECPFGAEDHKKMFSTHRSLKSLFESLSILSRLAGIRWLRLEVFCQLHNIHRSICPRCESEKTKKYLFFNVYSSKPKLYVVMCYCRARKADTINSEFCLKTGLCLRFIPWHLIEKTILKTARIVTRNPK